MSRKFTSVDGSVRTVLVVAGSVCTMPVAAVAGGPVCSGGPVCFGGTVRADRLARRVGICFYYFNII